MRLFADAFYFIALLDRSDQHHPAVSAYRGVQGATLVTTQWVLAKVANALSSPETRRQSATFIQELCWHPSFVVHPATDAMFSDGLTRYTKRPDKAWSLTDCISFIVMEQEGLDQALTGDRHFAQAGFTALFAVN